MNLDNINKRNTREWVRANENSQSAHHLERKLSHNTGESFTKRVQNGSGSESKSTLPHQSIKNQKRNGFLFTQTVTKN